MTYIPKLPFHVEPKWSIRRKSVVLGSPFLASRYDRLGPQFPDPLNAEVITMRIIERVETFILEGKAPRRAVPEQAPALPRRKPSAAALPADVLRRPLDNGQRQNPGSRHWRAHVRIVRTGAARLAAARG